MAIINPNRVLAISSGYLNIPITAGISPNGYWYRYIPANVGNTGLNSKIVPYRWGTQLPLQGGATEMTIDGTMPFISESWNSVATNYHGGCIEWIGPGENDITNAQEDDAFFFAHLGTLSTAPDDDVFYWDRAYEPFAGTDWEYYQYHQHSPTFYATWENGRQVIGGDGWIDPGDKAYGYMITTQVKVSGTDYASVLARIHTPSIGGAHNSHNDQTLPTTGNKNYMPGGILRGVGERYHCFYIAANGSQWDLFTRTYTDASGAFSSQNTIGTFDFADPSFNPSLNQQSWYPVRAACGTTFGAKIYFPVIMNNSVSGFDLEIWSFNSLDSIAGGSLTRQVIASGLTQRPDCYCSLYGNEKLYVLYSDIANGGTRLWSYDGTTWTNEGAFLTNSAAQPIRIHGFEFNTEDFKYYALLSGTASGGGTFLGTGLYTFEFDDPFPGYEHLDYDYTTNSFIKRDPLETGYVEYNSITAQLTRVNATEPQAIGANTNILKYTQPNNQWFNRKQVGFGGKDFYYHTITLRDGRRFAVGQVVDNPDNVGVPGSGDFLVSIYSPDLQTVLNFAAGTTGDDYLTGVWESQTSNKVWMTGYCKGAVVPYGEIWIHGWCRNLSDGGNAMEYKDIAIDSLGNVYCVGSHDAGWLVVTKYDKNYVIQWQKRIGDDTSFSDIGTGIAIDSSDNIYIVGSTEETGSGSKDALLIKMNSAGSILFAKVYGNASSNSASSVCVIKKATTDYIVFSVVTITDTAFVVTDTSGNIVEQNVVSNLVTNHVRPNQSTPTGGRFLFAGTTYPAGVTYTITNQGTNNYVWNGGIYVDTTDPSPVTLYRGYTYTFNMNASGHPFWIKTAQVTGTGSAYNTGVTNNGTAVGTITFTVPLDAPSTLYYVCQFHSGMAGTFSIQDGTSQGRFGMAEITSSTGRMIQWNRSISSANNVVAYDMRNTDAPVGGIGAGYAISGSDGTNGLLIKVSVDEAAGNYTVTSSWQKNMATSVFRAMHVSPYTDTTRYIYAVGTTDNSGVAPMGMNEGLMTKWLASNGTLEHQNVFGHDMDEQWVAVIPDFTGRNIIVAGWSESHSDSRDAVFFRYDKNGFGTGVYNLTETGTAPYYYNIVSLATSTNTATVGSLTAPIDVSPSFATNTYTPYIENSDYLSRNFDGAFGANGLFTFIMAYLDLELLQEWLNGPVYKAAVARGDKIIYFDDVSAIGGFYQAATVGDGSADDGNMFGYDIIEHSNGKIYAIGQTSGDITMTNLGLSGVYDYLLVELDPATGDMEFYQNGTEKDEETYALTELADGRIAYVGRTTGTLADPNEGGYDIFLGIFDTNTETSDYYSIGSGLDDVGVNVHDLNNGSNELAVVYFSFGSLTGTTNSGSQDIGVIKFNYVTDTWGTAWQTGSNTSELYVQNGKPSALISNDRIAITASSVGVFADDAVTYGYLDVCVAILNFVTGEWVKNQIGTTANEIASSLSAFGDTLLISGNQGGSFTDDIDAIFVEYDALEGLVGITSSI